MDLHDIVLTNLFDGSLSEGDEITIRSYLDFNADLTAHFMVEFDQ